MEQKINLLKAWQEIIKGTIKIPDTCPHCGEGVVIEEGEVLVCPDCEQELFEAEDQAWGV